MAASAAEQQQFYLLLGNLLSPDNVVRKQAEVIELVVQTPCPGRRADSSSDTATPGLGCSAATAQAGTGEWWLFSPRVRGPKDPGGALGPFRLLQPRGPAPIFPQSRLTHTCAAAAHIQPPPRQGSPEAGREVGRAPGLLSPLSGSLPWGASPVVSTQPNLSPPNPGCYPYFSLDPSL